MAFMGFLDDFIKVRRRHNRGIFWKQKNYVTMLLSFGIAWWLVAGDRDRRDDLADPGRLPRVGPADLGVGDLGRADHLGDHQRGQRHRRPRRPRRRGGADGVRRVHDHRLLGVPQSGDLRGGGQPARHRRPRRRLRRRLHGVPVVQRRPGADHHGRRRRARPGLGAGPARVGHEHAAADRADLRAQRDRSRLGRPADGRVQGERAALPAVLDVADPPSLRARRVAGDDGDHPLLVDRGGVRGAPPSACSSATSPGSRRTCRDHRPSCTDSAVAGAATGGRPAAPRRRGRAVDDTVDEPRRSSPPSSESSWSWPRTTTSSSDS